VDAGMVAVLNRKEQENFIGLLAAMGRGDGEEAANFVMNFSVKSEYSPTIRMKFRKGMVELFGKVCRGYGTHVDIGEVLRGILSLVRDNKISIDANYATLVLNAMCLDGLGKQLLPSYSILDGGKPLLEFYRVSRKTIGLGIFYFLAPISQFIKRKNDNFFLKFLKKKYPEYNKHQYVPI
jgi:aarF domain-containing kinase